MRLARSVAFALLATLALARPALAQQAQEYEVKAAFLYKFPAFVEWPAQKPGPFIIAVAGAPDTAAELERLAKGHTINARPIVVKPLAEGESPAGANVLFIGRDSGRLARLAAAVAGTPVLIVSEAPGALDEGSMVNFTVADGRVRFEVALDAAERAGLRISPRLLAVAIDVRSSRP